MAVENEGKEWGALSKSVQGASHIRANLPNQDYIDQKVHQGHGLPIMLAVADGHGSATYFRSDLGARFAVEIALEEMERSISELHFPIKNIATVKELMKQLPGAIVERWHERVRAHAQKTGLTPEEFQRYNPKLLESFIRALKENPSRSYGTTLLGVLVTFSFIFYFQLGDGDILIVTEDRQVKPAVKGDTRLLANETTSLCTTDKNRALRDFRTSFDHLDDPKRKGPHPALILLSTDGYSNSFNTPEGFQQVGLDIMSILARDGAEKVKQELPNWLHATTEAGSGDDISLGLIWHRNFVQKATTTLPKHIPLDAPADVTLLRRPGTQSGPSDNQPSAQHLQEPPRSEDAFLIDYEGPTSTQRVPTVVDLLYHSKEVFDEGRWRDENYQPPVREETVPVEVGANSSPAQNEPAAPGELFPSQEPEHNVPAQAEQPSPPQTQASLSERDSTAPFTSINEQQKQPEAEQKPVQITPVSTEPLAKAGPSPLIVKQDAALGEYRTISDALKKAKPGMTIVVYPGTYRERLIVDQDVKIYCQHPNTVIVENNVPCLQLTARQAQIDGLFFKGKAALKIGMLPGKDSAAVEIPAGQSLLNGCDITSESSMCVHVRSTGTMPELHNCFIHDGPSAGIVFSEDAQGKLEKCIVTHQRGVGVEIRGSNPVIFQCKFHGNEEDGILIWKLGGGRIDQCEIDTYGQCGIKVREGNPMITECQIHHGTGPGVVVLEHGRGTISGCKLHHNGGPDIYLQSGNQTSIRSCHFMGGGRKGAIIVDAQSQGIIEDCHITEQVGPGILVLQGNVFLQHSEIRSGKAQGVLLRGQSTGTFNDCILSNQISNAIEVREGSTLTLKDIQIFQERQNTNTISLEDKSYVSLERCHIEATNATGLYLNRKSNARLYASHILSKASNAVVVLNESTLTLQRSDAQTEGSGKNIYCDESSHIDYQD